MVTRRDLSLPYQAVQSGHAGINFQQDHPKLARNWFTNSNYLVFLSVKDETELEKLIFKANLKGITISIFREPDIGNEITAVAFEPCSKSKRLTYGLPLLGNTIIK